MGKKTRINKIMQIKNLTKVCVCVPVHKVNLRCQHQLGLTAIGTCVGVVLLGLLVIAIFLAWRWSKKSLNSNKTLPGANERGIRETWPGGGRPPLPPPPPGPIVYQGAPPNNIYSPKYCIPSQVSIPSCGHTQCQGVCQAITQHPYTLHPVTRPLLTPPSPSINSQTHIPIDWLYPSPYDDDTHWYTTIGRDGREYLTGEIKRDHPSPPPLPQDSPPPNLTSLPPSSPTLSSVKRGNSFSQSSTSTSQGTPTLKNRPMPPTLALKEDLINSDRQRIPVTYI
ncbi:hypothetical protein Anas_05872 [Armadillidium nasatum]|uniref:Uncharacterized protein n=1 Tax=Armadillidium nasatum TaxID=96803 RepID=A0A5N5T0N2_9CRUS|nr:hypothetical protein Anas_05872 [Armadillidium nasatum]